MAVPSSSSSTLMPLRYTATCFTCANSRCSSAGSTPIATAAVSPAGGGPHSQNEFAPLYTRGSPKDAPYRSAAPASP